MRSPLLVSLILLFAVPTACGGRFVNTDGEDQGGSSSGGSSSSQGAKTGTGGKPIKGGATSMGGAFGTAGSSVGGGSAPAGGSTTSGGACACPDIACKPGTRPVPNPNGCCYYCEPACGGMPCAGIACASGSHLELLPGQCCPTCVQDDCQRQREQYEVFKRQLLEKYSSAGCMVNQDCGTWYEKNQCAVGCGVAIPVSLLNSLESNLQSYASQSCSGSCPVAVPPCPMLPAPVCVQGRCQVGF